MSVISQHWQPGTSQHRPSGSMHRPSGQYARDSTHRNTKGESFFEKDGRASSTFAVENNMAGRGTNFTDVPEMSQRAGGERPTFGRGASYIDRQSHGSEFANTSAPPGGRAISMFDDGKKNRVSFAGQESGQRASRISFGDALRPTHSNHSGLSGGPKGKAASIHSLPTKSTPPRRSMAEEMNVSPAQAQGPFVLGEDEVDGRGRPSVDEGLRSMEAVMLMRKQQSGNATRVAANEGIEVLDEHHQSSDSVGRPSLSSNRTSSFHAASPLSQHIGLPSPPLAATSTLIPGATLSSSTSITPDDALRAYAQRSAHANGGTPRFELGQNERGLGMGAIPMASPGLVSPVAGNTNRLSVASGANNPFRNSM